MLHKPNVVGSNPAPVRPSKRLTRSAKAVSDQNSFFGTLRLFLKSFFSYFFDIHVKKALSFSGMFSMVFYRFLLTIVKAAKVRFH